MSNPKRADGGPVHLDTCAQAEVCAGVHRTDCAGLGSDSEVASRVTDDNTRERSGIGAGGECGGCGDRHRGEELLHWASLLREVGYLLKSPARPKTCRGHLSASAPPPPAAS